MDNEKQDFQGYGDNAEPVNRVLKSHICSLNYKEWSLANITQRLYFVYKILNHELFSGVLSTPVITIGKLRVTTLGCYYIGRNEFGAKNHIKLNTKHLYRSKVEIYSTLLHEMLHQNEYEIHCKKKNRGNYHSSFFRFHAAKFGIPCTAEGVGLGIRTPSPFISALIKHNLFEEEGFDLVQGGNSVDAEESPRSKLLKYTCGCTNVRVASIDFKAQCRQPECGIFFRLAEKSLQLFVDM